MSEITRIIDAVRTNKKIDIDNNELYKECIVLCRNAHGFAKKIICGRPVFDWLYYELIDLETELSPKEKLGEMIYKYEFCHNITLK